MEQITLRFIGDLNAIGLANNLLSAALDKPVQQGMPWESTGAGSPGRAPRCGDPGRVRGST